MTTVSVALLAGKPHVGKSYLLPKLKENGWAVLVSDTEIMKRMFDLLPRERGHNLHQKIAPGDAWKHLYKDVDVDRLMRLHHRDWLSRHGFPTEVVAEGWIYVKRRHREQVYSAFAPAKFKDMSFRFCLIHYLPPKHVYVARHIKAICERRGPDDSFFRLAAEQQRAQAEADYDYHVQTIFEGPIEEPGPFETLGDEGDVLRYLQAFFNWT